MISEFLPADAAFCPVTLSHVLSEADPMLQGRGATCNAPDWSDGGVVRTCEKNETRALRLSVHSILQHEGQRRQHALNAAGDLTA